MILEEEFDRRLSAGLMCACTATPMKHRWSSPANRQRQA